MPKPPHRPPTGSPSEQDELSDLMAMLEEPAGDDEGEPVDSGDLVALLEGLGASAKEREEEEVRNLLEGMPELGEDGSTRDGGVESEAVPMLEDDGEDDDTEAVVSLQALFATGRDRGHDSSRERVAVRARIEREPIAVGDEDDFLALEAVVPPSRQRAEAADALRALERTARDGEIPPVQATHDEPLLPPLRDPLASRRALGDKRLKQFVEEEVGTRLKFRILRMLLVGGLERISLDELQEELVEEREAIRKAVAALDASGLLLVEPAGCSINPRARKLVLLGTAIAQWQSARHRAEVLSWLTEDA